MLLLLLGIGLATMLALILIVPREYRRLLVELPQCPSCRYQVHMLGSTVCPECGTDFAAIGVYQPGARLRLLRIAHCVLTIVAAFTVVPAITLLCDEHIAGRVQGGSAITLGMLAVSTWAIFIVSRRAVSKKG